MRNFMVGTQGFQAVLNRLFLCHYIIFLPQKHKILQEHVTKKRMHTSESYQQQWAKAQMAPAMHKWPG